ncbi:MAG: type II toxin-antitoxin system Phd/YefM family antitoxin [Polyangiales bacterium]
MTIVAKGELKARLLAYMRQVERSGETLIITDRGVPTLKLVPIAAPRQPDDVFADLRAVVELPEDAVLENTETEWEGL